MFQSYSTAIVLGSQVEVKEGKSPATDRVFRAPGKVFIILVNADHLGWVDKDEEATRVEERVVCVVRLHPFED